MHHELDPADVEWLRSKSVTERFQMMCVLNEMGRRIIADETRLKRPEWSDEQVSKEVARRLLQGENLPELYASDFRETGLFDDITST